MARWYIYTVAFVGGAAVLAIEILGTRILGPFYGVTLFLWTALITTALVALSAGYAIGGKWADRGARMSHLSLILVLAGLWTVLTPWITPPILRTLDPLGLRLAALTAAFALFVPSLTLLGMVSPIAIRLQAKRLDTVGSSAGNLYALSTIGSVLASVVTGFYLIPYVGVTRLTLLIGIKLIVLGVIGLIPLLKQRASRNALVGLVGLGGIGVVVTPISEVDPNHGLIAAFHSAYADIRVIDYHNRRHLVMDGIIHSLCDTSNWQSDIPYTATLQLTSYMFPKPGRMLLVGLGAGSSMKDFHNMGWAVTAVEIDPVVVDVAQKYFGLREADGAIYTADGRQFLNNANDKYELIVVDAYGSSLTPFHMVTTECFAVIRERLNAGGIVAINIITGGWDHIMVRGFAATLQQEFSHVLVLPAGYADRNGNVIMVASNEEISLKREFLGQGHIAGVEQFMKLGWENRFVPSTTNAPILTDDLNQVETWTEQINLAQRKALHAYFTEAGLGW